MTDASTENRECCSAATTNPQVYVVIDGRQVGPHSTVEDVNALCTHVCSFPRPVCAALADVLAASIETRGILPPSARLPFSVPADKANFLETRQSSPEEIAAVVAILTVGDKP